MKLKDFKNTKVMKKETAKKSFQGACELCLGINPSMYDGYTTCCNECRVDAQTAIKLAKQEDIMQFLNMKFNDVYSHGNASFTSKIEFVLPTKSKRFSLILSQTEEALCENILNEIKGLRKDKKD